MALPSIFPTRPLHLDRFLHATIGMERNGMDLSVLSMLARLGCDPWMEATRLAGLPMATAVDSLAATIARLPAGSRTQGHARMIALCLVPLLPGQASPAPDAIPAGKRNDSRMVPAPLAGVVFSSALVLGLLMGAMAWAVSHGPPGAASAGKPPPAAWMPWPSPGGP